MFVQLKLQSASLTLAHCHCRYFFPEFLDCVAAEVGSSSSSRPWWSFNSLIATPSPHHHLQLPSSGPVCCTLPPIIGGFTAQSLLPWNATSRGTIKQVVFIMEAQAVWPYRLSGVWHVSGLSAPLVWSVKLQTFIRICLCSVTLIPGPMGMKGHLIKSGWKIN